MRTREQWPEFLGQHRQSILPDGSGWRSVSRSEVAFDAKYPGWPLVERDIAKELAATPQRAWELLQGGWPYQLTRHLTVDEDVLLAFMDGLGAFRIAAVAVSLNDRDLGIVLLMESSYHPEVVEDLAAICADEWHRSRGGGFNVKKAVKAMQKALEFSGYELPDDAATDASLFGEANQFHGLAIPPTMFVTVMANRDLRLRVSKAPFIQKYREAMA